MTATEMKTARHHAREKLRQAWERHVEHAARCQEAADSDMATIHCAIADDLKERIDLMDWITRRAADLAAQLPEDVDWLRLPVENLVACAMTNVCEHLDFL